MLKSSFGLSSYLTDNTVCPNYKHQTGCEFTDERQFSESAVIFVRFYKKIWNCGHILVKNIYLPGFLTAVAVFQKTNAIPLCFPIDLVLNFLLSWLLVLLPSTFFLILIYQGLEEESLDQKSPGPPGWGLMQRASSSLITKKQEMLKNQTQSLGNSQKYETRN